MGSSNTSRLVSAKEVAHQDSADDCWVVIDNQVWDVTAFATGHPGGADSKFTLHQPFPLEGKLILKSSYPPTCWR